MIPIDRWEQIMKFSSHFQWEHYKAREITTSARLWNTPPDDMIIQIMRERAHNRIQTYQLLKKAEDSL